MRLKNGLQITRGPSKMQRAFERRLTSVWEDFSRTNSLVIFFATMKNVNREDIQLLRREEELLSASDNEEEEEEISVETEQSSASEKCKVCLVEIATSDARHCLIPCGHAPFCSSCIGILMEGLPPNREPGVNIM